MSSFLGGGCALPAQMNLLAALEKKSKTGHDYFLFALQKTAQVSTICDYLIPSLQILHYFWHFLASYNLCTFAVC